MGEKTHINQPAIPLAMPDIKRQTAIKCTIKKILEGNYVQKPGWEPNYVEISGKKISRANILAAIISKETSLIKIDDGSGQITVRFFSEQEKADNLHVGDIILLIGRPREYNNERYLVPEIIRVIKEKGWIEHRKKELGSQEVSAKPAKKQEVQKKSMPQAAPVQEEYLDNEPLKILESIKKLDAGEGADIEAIIKQSGVKNADKHIQEMINEGEIYEIRPGKLKIL